MGEARVQAPSRRAARTVLVLALLALAILLSLRFVLQPERATRFLLERAGTALGLEITAGGAAEYTLRGTPTLVVRDLVAREPGAAEPLLRADRILLSLPWSTIRARGTVLAATRLELDSPVLQLHALQHWLSTQPPSEAPRFPSFEQGLRVVDGTILPGGAGDWRLAGIGIDMPRLAPDDPVHARLRGRYEAPPMRVPFDLALAMQRAGALVDARPTGLGVVGRIAVDGGGDWRMPAHLRLSGPFLLDSGEVRILPLTMGIGAQYASKDSRMPFALGAHGPLGYADGALSLQPLQLLLRGRGQPSQDPIPEASARGHAVLAESLDLQLEGTVASWPEAWPALPEPLGQPRGPVPVVIDYRGPASFDGVVGLRASHGATRFDGRFRIAAITAWLDAGLATPLPPLDGSASTPLLEIAGARLEGVEITVDDPSIDPVE